MPLHDRLKHARQKAALSGSQVHERTGIGESSLSEFENGKRVPSLSQLQKLADLYNRSMSFFFADGPIVCEPTVLWRMRPQENAEQIEGRFLRLCEQYHNLEMWCNERELPSLPQLPPKRSDAAKFDCCDAEELAKQVRRELQLGDRPGPGLLTVLEELCGVKVFHLHFEPTGTAASTISDSFGAAVLLNAHHVRWQRNYDLAHELFHLLTWGLFHSATNGSIVAEEREENLADAFASSLLMPSEPFESAINNARARDGKITFESLFGIARQFDVSVEAVLSRVHLLYHHGQTEDGQTKRAMDQAKQLTPFVENRDDSKPTLLPDRYRALAVKALRRGEIAIGRFAEYLSISRQEAMRFVEQETTEDEEVPIASA